MVGRTSGSVRLSVEGHSDGATLNRVLRARGFWTPERPEPDLLGMLHHVALGTVADVAPLIGLNRAFVAKGLIAMRRRDHVGHTALMDVARLAGPPEPPISGVVRHAQAPVPGVLVICFNVGNSSLTPWRSPRTIAWK